MSTLFFAPALELNFISATLDPRVDLTRALDTATRVNSSGYVEVVNANLPRFDYNPVTLESKGLLIEETRVNLLTRSAELNVNLPWQPANATIAQNAVIAPDGTQTADVFTPTGSPAILQQILAKSATATTYTFSFYAKASGFTTIRAFIYGQSTNNRADASFNLSTGVVISAVSAGTFTNTSATIRDVGNGWYRGTVTTTSDATTQIVTYFRYDAGASGSNGIALWGTQLEVGAFATSYIPTTTTALTRDADVATITGGNFSDFWQASKGGTRVLATPSTVSGIRPLVQFDDGTANEVITLRGNTTNPELYIRTGGVDQAQIDAGTIAANTPYDLFGVWNTDDCAAKVNNGTKVFDTSATIPTVTQMRIGSDGANYLNGTIASVSYYSGDQLAGVGRYMFTRRKNKVIQPPIF